MLNNKRFIFRMATISLEAMLLLATPAFAVSPGSIPDSEPMRVRVNGIALDVRSKLVPLPPESLANAILAAWRDAGTAGLRFNPAAGRTVLGRQSGPVHETVTLLDTPDPDRTAVVHATQDLSQGVARLPSLPFVLPRGMRVVEAIEQLERNVPNTTFRLESSLNKLEAIERVRLALLESRWSITARMVSVDRTCMIEAERGTQKVMVLAIEGDSKNRLVVEVTGRAS
jgi:hypothetical protein